MGRCESLSMSEAKKLVSNYITNKKVESEYCYTTTHYDGEKKYSLKEVQLNEDSRIAKIDFLETKYYRTIVRYVTQNYVRHPVYSNWKTKTKIIRKTIKLTNQELENLQQNDDEFISKFAKEIIIEIKNEELIPAWFYRFALLEEYSQKSNQLHNQFKSIKDELNNKINKNRSNINANNKELSSLQNDLTIKQKKLAKVELKIKKINNSKKNPFKYIFTFFVYTYLVSAGRKQKFVNKNNLIQTEIKKLKILILQHNENIRNLNEDIDKLSIEIKEKEELLRKDIQKEYNELGKRQRQVKPLPSDLSTDSEDFILLNSIKGFEYKKIVGCYVIRNRENHKCYVGQSKDVHKRLRQHFKGTVPNNIIFAEDYYNVPHDKRDELFEVKIISCNTKDELDSTEKKLIEEYDAFGSGYNSTSGNT